MNRIIHDFNLSLNHFTIPRKTVRALSNLGFELIDVNDSKKSDLDSVEIFFGNRLKTPDLALYPNLRYVHLGCMGYDNLDLNILKLKDIILTNSTGIVEKSISEMVLAAILYFMRGLHLNNLDTISTGRMVLDSHYNELKPIHTCNAIVFGIGNIGKEIVENLSLNGVKCVGVNSTGESSNSFYKVLSLSDASKVVGDFDFIVNALPHNSSTNELFDYQYFNKFKSNSIYLNVGRKQTTSQKDLVKWLVSSKSRGIYLDVYDDSIIKSLKKLDDKIKKKIILTPHNSGWSSDYWTKQEKLFVNNLFLYTNRELEKLLNRIC
jgi:lactate dehydrogenase-like 2-hydroxyacid dehydrogenase